MSGCSAYIEKFGGHPKAIGLSLHREMLDNFTEKFCVSVNKLNPGTSSKKRTVVFDHQIENEADIVNKTFISLLRQFEPFGENNPEPVFLLKGVQLTHITLIKGVHLKFSLQLNERSYRGIGFGMGEWLSAAQKKVNLTFKFKHSIYRGKKRVELMAVGITSV